MNDLQKEQLNKFLKESDELFCGELSTDENKEYRRGYYAGRLHAALSIKNMIDNNDGFDAMEIKFYE